VVLVGVVADLDALLLHAVDVEDVVANLDPVPGRPTTRFT